MRISYAVFLVVRNTAAERAHYAQQLRIAGILIAGHAVGEEQADDGDEYVRAPHRRHGRDDKAVREVFAADETHPVQHEERDAVDDARADAALAGHDSEGRADEDEHEAGERRAEFFVNFDPVLGLPAFRVIEAVAGTFHDARTGAFRKEDVAKRAHM